MANKITDTEILKALLTMATENGYEEGIEYLNRKLDQKAKAKEKAQEKDGEKVTLNLAIETEILSILNGATEGMNVDAMREMSEKLGKESNQKITYLLTDMVKRGLVAKGKSGRKTVYSIPTDNAE